MRESCDSKKVFVLKNSKIHEKGRNEKILSLIHIFQVEQPGDISDRLVPGTWANPVSFGFNDWNAQVYCLFQVNTDNGGTEMEIDAHGITKNRVDGSYGAYWGPIVGDIAGGTMHNLSLIHIFSATIKKSI